MATALDFMLHSWQPPEEGFIKCNSDGSYREESQVMGSGGVLRDHRGKWLGGFYSKVPDNPLASPFMAEACALRDVLRLAWDQGHRKIRCETDCANLVSTLEDGDNLHLHSAYSVLFSIKELLTRNWLVTLNVISRECNKAVDYLAKLGAAAATTDFWVLNQPDVELEVLLIKDSDVAS
uniref:RNase H type-1 domain-containing protein n=1 Tax=Lotus japonicus TaxID=34305 RepID=I3S2I6_LOTJA|nr:unknown [Lotus japonicus]